MSIVGNILVLCVKIKLIESIVLLWLFIVLSTKKPLRVWYKYNWGPWQWSHSKWACEHTFVQFTNFVEAMFLESRYYERKGQFHNM